MIENSHMPVVSQTRERVRNAEFIGQVLTFVGVENMPGNITWNLRGVCLSRAYDTAALEAWGTAAQVNLTIPGLTAAPGAAQPLDAPMHLAGALPGAPVTAY